MDQMSKTHALPSEPREFGFYVDGNYIEIGDREVLSGIRLGMTCP